MAGFRGRRALVAWLIARRNGVLEVARTEVRPVLIDEDELRVSNLPEEEVRDP
jgi:hypothetical protein